MKKSYNTAIRVLLDADLAEFLRDESCREGNSRASVIRQAIAARRDRRLAEERENHRQAMALFDKVEAEFERTSSGVN